MMPSMENGGNQVIGKMEAAAILGAHPNNLKSGGKWQYGLPPTLQERGLAEAKVTPLWYRSEVVQAARDRGRA